MCGRYLIDQKLIKTLKMEKQISIYDILPGKPALVLENRQEGIKISEWGDEVYNRFMINARVETLEKHGYPDFQRCIVFARKFYEPSIDGPVLFSLESNSILFMAGIIKNNHFLVITTNANESVSKFHDRMPLVISYQDIDKWLNNEDYSYFINKQPQYKASYTKQLSLF